MKYLITLIVCITFFSCQQRGSQNSADDSISSTTTVVGGDKDKNGCLVAAGYTWSKIKEECVRPWEGTISMNITDTSSNFETAAFVLIDSTKQQAEIFLKEETESLLLDSVSPHLYANQNYKLSQADHCWSLTHGEKTLYKEKK